MNDSLSGRLLVASPSMSDYFHRTVTLVIEHNPEGAFGLVLNRPSEATVGDATPELAELIGGEHMLYIGGPVQPNAVTAIAEHADPGEGVIGMGIGEDPGLGLHLAVELFWAPARVACEDAHAGHVRR